MTAFHEQWWHTVLVAKTTWLKITMSSPWKHHLSLFLYYCCSCTPTHLLSLSQSTQKNGAKIKKTLFCDFWSDPRTSIILLSRQFDDRSPPQQTNYTVQLTHHDSYLSSKLYSFFIIIRMYYIIQTMSTFNTCRIMALPVLNFFFFLILLFVLPLKHYCDLDLYH